MEGTLPILKELLDGTEGLVARLPEAAALVRSGRWPAELLAVAAGVALLTAGARLGRVLAAAGGMLLGWFTGLALAPAFQGWGIRPAVVGLALGAALAVASFFAPLAYPLLLGVFPGALLGSRFPIAGQPSIGAAAGALALGAAGMVLRRVIPAATAAAAGAALVCIALAALFPKPSGIGLLVNKAPLLLGLALVLFVAGTAFQLGRGGAGGRRGPSGDHQLLRDD